MSTKSTIAAGSGWHLEEEMLTETTHLVVTNPALELYSGEHGANVTLQIPPSLLDEIARVHAERGFPHQRGNPVEEG